MDDNTLCPTCGGEPPAKITFDPWDPLEPLLRLIMSPPHDEHCPFWKVGHDEPCSCGVGDSNDAIGKLAALARDALALPPLPSTSWQLGYEKGLATKDHEAGKDMPAAEPELHTAWLTEAPVGGGHIALCTCRWRGATHGLSAAAYAEMAEHIESATSAEGSVVKGEWQEGYEFGYRAGIADGELLPSDRP